MEYDMREFFCLAAENSYEWTIILFTLTESAAEQVLSDFYILLL